MDCNIARSPHVQSYWCTFNHSITCSVARTYLTTLSFIVQHSHIYTRYIAKLNAFASHNDRLRSMAFCTNNFLIWNYFGNSLSPNLNFSIVWIFLSLLLVHKLWKSLTINIFNLEKITFYRRASKFSGDEIVTMIMIIKVIIGNDW